MCSSLSSLAACVFATCPSHPFYSLAINADHAALCLYHLQENHPGLVVSLDVRADGPSQLLVLSKYEQDSNAFKPTGRSSLSRTNTIDSSVAFEAVATDTSVNTTLNFEFEGIGISVLDKKMHELVYITFRRLELHYVDTVSSYSASIDCKWIQIDNQLFGGLYPIILYPTNIPKDGKELEAHPTLQASVIVLKDESTSSSALPHWPCLCSQRLI